jgi:hypothetical protein
MGTTRILVHLWLCVVVVRGGRGVWPAAHRRGVHAPEDGLRRVVRATAVARTAAERPEVR